MTFPDKRSLLGNRLNPLNFNEWLLDMNAISTFRQLGIRTSMSGVSAVLTLGAVEEAEASFAFDGFLDSETVDELSDFDATGGTSSLTVLGTDLSIGPAPPGFPNLFSAAINLDTTAYPEITGYRVDLTGTSIPAGGTLILDIGGDLVVLNDGDSLSNAFFSAGPSLSVLFSGATTDTATLSGLSLTAVPEPSTAIPTLIILCLPLLFLRRRRFA